MPSVFILIGQSNMAGAARSEDLPDDPRQFPPGIRLYEDGDWRELVWRETFGPEVGFARRIGESLSDPAILCKVARGGSNLYYDWDPERTEGGLEDAYRGPLYRKLLTALETVRGEPGAEFAGAFWAQGARDSVFESMADAYDRNLESFIFRLRTDTRTPHLPFMIVRGMPRSVNPETGKPRHPFKAIVREAQHDVAERVPGVHLVEAGDIPQFDDLHYDASGQLELGRRLAEAWIGRPSH